MRTYLFFIVLISINGCAIYPMEYYAPAGENGVVVDSHCGPKNAMLYNFQGVQLIVSLGYNSKYIGNVIFENEYPIHELKNSDFERHLGLEVIVKVPEKTSFGFKKNEFMIQVDETETEKLSLDRLTYLSPNPPYKFLIANPVSTLSGHNVSGGLLQDSKPSDYRGHIWFTAEKFDTLLLKFPEIVVNGKEYQIKNLRFTRSKKIQFSPLNC